MHEGTRVRALATIDDQDPVTGRQWVTCHAGDEGVVELVEPGFLPTVRFESTGCSKGIDPALLEVLS